MPTPAYLNIEGTKQGRISAGALGEASAGNAWQSAHTDKILVQAMTHSIIVPGGTGATHRVHKPLVITKSVDKSSPLLNNALCSGEVLKTCRLEFYRTSVNGTQERFYTIDLSDAIIVAVELIMPHCQDLNTAHFTQMERIHFAYQSIIWKHETGGTIGMDEWRGE